VEDIVEAEVDYCLAEDQAVGRLSHCRDVVEVGNNSGRRPCWCVIWVVPRTVVAWRLFTLPNICCKPYLLKRCRMKAMYRRNEMRERRRDVFLASGEIAISVRLNWGVLRGADRTQTFQRRVRYVALRPGAKRNVVEFAWLMAEEALSKCDLGDVFVLSKEQSRQVVW